MTDRETLEAIAKIVWDPRLTRERIMAKVARLLEDAGLAPALIGVEDSE